MEEKKCQTNIANTLIQVDQAINTGIGIAALKDQQRIQSEAALKVQLKQAGSGGWTPAGDGALRDEVDLLAKQVRRLEVELAQRDMAILDWMHSNEAFKRLQRNYGKKLELADEQRQSDFDQTALDIAKEDPKFADTNFLKGIKDRVKKSSSLEAK